jgi:hypothetical protein
MTRTIVDLLEPCLACEAGKNGGARLRNYIRLSRTGLLRLTQSVRLCSTAEPWSMGFAKTVELGSSRDRFARFPA